ncbi:hypothetical protein MMC07_001079 [Pseudocyphellaria aurata]|nr:hypothetical protein [Pseudocyphellaria aurata]
MSVEGSKSYPGGHYNERQRELVGVAIFGLIVSTLAVGLRITARRRLKIAIWWDDYLAILALVSVWNGLGRHVSQISPDQNKVIGVTSFIVQTSYTFAFALVNITILILYVRIFPVERLHKACYGIGAFSVIWCLVNEVVLFAQCIPVRKFWDPEVDGHCINQNILYSVAGFICLVNILIIYAVPLPLIMKLQVSRSRKWALAIAFTVGSFSCISGVVRLILSLTLDHEDLTWSISSSILWGCLEISTQVVSACIPSLMPLFLSVMRKGRRNKESGPEPNSEGKKKKSAEPRKPRSYRFLSLLSLGDPELLPEALDLSMISRSVPNETDNLGLVEAGKRSLSGIVVTAQIDQVNESRRAASESKTVAE